MRPLLVILPSSLRHIAPRTTVRRHACLCACASVLLASSVLPAVLLATTPVHAQGKPTPADVQAEPKQVPLTQQQVDGVVNAQKSIHALEAKVPEQDADKPNPKLDAAIAETVKKNGFADVDAFANASFSIGMVLAGMDPDTKQYVGAAAVTKKQIAAVQADKGMSPKDKKEALDELNATSKQASSEKPLDGNVALVSKNYDALNTALQGDAE